MHYTEMTSFNTHTRYMFGQYKASFHWTQQSVTNAHWFTTQHNSIHTLSASFIWYNIVSEPTISMA